jgi:hypothetical protein
MSLYERSGHYFYIIRDEWNYYIPEETNANIISLLLTDISDRVDKDFPDVGHHVMKDKTRIALREYFVTGQYSSVNGR